MGSVVTVASVVVTHEVGVRFPAPQLVQGPGGGGDTTSVSEAEGSGSNPGRGNSRAALARTGILSPNKSRHLEIESRIVLGGVPQLNRMLKNVPIEAHLLT